MSATKHTTDNGAPYRVPPEPNRWPSIGLAVGVHALLLAFLWIGVSWQNNTPVTIEAEVWDVNTQTAAPPPPPPAPEPEPEPEPQPDTPPPPPAPAPRVVEEPAPPKQPDIALEREKKRKEELKRQQAEEERQERLERERELAEQKRADEKKAKALADKKERELAEKKEREKERELAEKKEREAAEKKELARKEEAEKKKAEKEKAEKLAKAAKEKAAKDKAAKAEAAQLAKLRDMEVQRITGNGNPGSTGTAAKSTAPRLDSGYLGAIAAKIKSNANYAGDTDVPGNPMVSFVVEQLPTGEIVSVRKTKSSGIPEFDDAVERSINKSSPLPKKKDGTVERSLPVNFRMKDLN